MNKGRASDTTASIFISYARGDDEAFVRQLHRDLRKRRIHVWWDRQAMESRGRTFLQEIRDAVASVERLLLIVGPKAAQSEYVRAEWELALNSCKAVTPILRLGSLELLPKPLAKYHCLDFRAERPYNDAMEELGRILREPVPPLAQLRGVDALPAHFLSRPAEFQRLRKAIMANVLEPVDVPPARRTTALIGMGGAGKSVLAASFARSCDVRRAFPDGVVWIRLGRGTGPLAGFRLLGQAPGDDELEKAPDRQSGALRLPDLLEAKACLIVLDDVWDLAVAELFSSALGARCRQLLTTRDRRLVTALGAQEHEVGVLTEADALRLLADWCSQPVAELPLAARNITRECGNLPAALAMIGAMVRDNPRRWEQALRKLRNADLERIARQFPNYPYPNLLRATQVSVEALGSELRERYLDFAVFPEDTPIPEATIETFWASRGLAADRTQELLDVLVDRSLARRDEHGHLMLHDLQVDYVRNQAGDLRILHDRLLEAYAKRCPDGWPSGPDDGYYFQAIDLNASPLLSVAQGHTRVLGGDGDQCLAGAGALLHGERPSTDAIGLPGSAGQNGSCAQDQQRSKVSVTRFGDWGCCPTGVCRQCCTGWARGRARQPAVARC